MITKMCHRYMTQTNAIGKMVLIDLLATKFQFVKHAIPGKHKVKHKKVKYACNTI